MVRLLACLVLLLAFFFFFLFCRTPAKSRLNRCDCHVSLTSHYFGLILAAPSQLHTNKKKRIIIEQTEKKLEREMSFDVKLN